MVACPQQRAEHQERPASIREFIGEKGVPATRLIGPEKGTTRQWLRTVPAVARTQQGCISARKNQQTLALDMAVSDPLVCRPPLATQRWEAGAGGCWFERNLVMVRWIGRAGDWKERLRTVVFLEERLPRVG